MANSPDPSVVAELKQKSAQSHRIMAATGSAADNSGHVFVRIPGTNEMLVRCRNDSDWSPSTVTAQAIHRVDFDGNPTEPLETYVLPPERFIGCEVLKARPDLNCVIHGHPQAQIDCSISGIEIRPISGSRSPYGGYGTGLARAGIPVYPRSILIAGPEAGQGVVKAMDGRDMCLLRGHGNVVCGTSIEHATIRLVQVENLAQLCMRMAMLGKNVPDISMEDVEEDLHPTQIASQRIAREGGGLRWSWMYMVKMAEAGGH